MIDLTPLDVRKRKGDFRRAMRGYEVAEVDSFLDLVAERLEELVRENVALKDRAAQLAEGLNAFRGREQAMTEALVTAQQLREDIRSQAGREAELTVREARMVKERIISEAKRAVALEQSALQQVHAQRERFLRAYRGFLEGQLNEVQVEAARKPGSPPGVEDAPVIESAPGGRS